MMYNSFKMPTKHGEVGRRGCLMCAAKAAPSM